MEKDLRYSALFEIYQGLLTERQKRIFSDYYLYDLSFGEIAFEDGATRQSVYDAIKKVKRKLDEFEKKLGIYAKNNEILDFLSDKSDKEFCDKIREILYR